MVVDADVQSITPTRVRNLSGALFDGYDFVAWDEYITGFTRPWDWPSTSPIFYWDFVTDGGTKISACSDGTAST